MEEQISVPLPPLAVRTTLEPEVPLHNQNSGQSVCADDVPEDGAVTQKLRLRAHAVEGFIFMVSV